MYDSTSSLLKHLLTLTAVRFNPKRLTTFVGSYSAITLETLSDMLTHYRVSTLAVKVSTGNLHSLPLPAIAHCQQGTSVEFVVLETVTVNEVSGYDPVKGAFTCAIDAFAQRWTGHLLLVSADTQSGEIHYEANRQQERGLSYQRIICFGVLFLLAVFGLGQAFLNYWPSGALLLLKLAGLSACVALLMDVYGKPIKFVQNLCHRHAETDCQAVLQSSAATLFGWLSWAEIGLLYFAGGVVALITAPAKSTFITLSFLTIVGLPFTLFSVVYQGLIIKKWCVICLTVVGILWSEFLLFWFSGEFSQAITDWPATLLSSISSVVSFLLVIAVWYLVKPWLTSHRDKRVTEQQLTRLERNSDLFRVYLQAQRYVNTTEWEHELIIGNPEASTTVTIVSNPFCKPCALAHDELIGWVDFFDMRIIYRFSPDSIDNSQTNQVLRHMFSIHDPAKQQQAIDDWYHLRDYAQWSALYPVQVTDESEKFLQRHRAWCQAAAIEHTPTIFINGHELNEPYRVDSLSHHLRHLTEEGTPVAA